MSHQDNYQLNVPCVYHINDNNNNLLLFGGYSIK